ACLVISRPHPGGAVKALGEAQDVYRFTTHNHALVNERTLGEGLLVIGAAGAHPVPSRTRSLSLPAPMILPGQPGGNVGHRQKYLPQLLLLFPRPGCTSYFRPRRDRHTIERIWIYLP